MNTITIARGNSESVSIHKNSAPVLRVDETVSLEEQIAQRAHELWHQRKREHGHDLIDWLQAESEINEWHQQQLRRGNSPTPTEKAQIL